MLSLLTLTLHFVPLEHQLGSGFGSGFSSHQRARHSNEDLDAFDEMTRQ
jgi:hypothetical protein